MSSLISAETMKAHHATWWAYAGGTRIRRTKTMRGAWGFDVTCSCGFDTRTGGAVRSYIESELWSHRYLAQSESRMEQ